MVKHSAGPWAVNPFNAQVDAFKDGRPLPVCQLLWPTDERSEAETQANARLIAEAPDMLAMLKDVASWVGDMCSCPADEEYHRKLLDCIAKAENRL